MNNMNPFSFFVKANAIRQVVENPQSAGKEAVWGIIQGYLLVIGTWLTGLLVVCGVLGFTNFINGPYLFFEVIFYILLFVIVATAVSAFVAYRKIKHGWEKLLIKYRSRHATHAEPVEVKVIDMTDD